LAFLGSEKKQVPHNHIERKITELNYFGYPKTNATVVNTFKRFKFYQVLTALAYKSVTASRQSQRSISSRQLTFLEENKK
jgi:hypothetical protein